MRLPPHLVEIIRADLEGDRSVPHVIEHLAGESLVVLDSRLAHERWVGGESADDWVGSELEDPLEISSVGKHLYPQTTSPSDFPLHDAPRYPLSWIQLTASARPVVTRSASSGERSQ